MEQELSIDFQMAYALKYADINIWLESQPVSTMALDRKIFLLGLAAGIHDEPELQAMLPPEVLANIPPKSFGYEFVAGGMITWVGFYQKLMSLQHIEALVLNGDLTEEEGIAEIQALEM